MENIEKPLTWVLVITLLGYLFIANYEYGGETSCTSKNGFNIEYEDKKTNIKQEIKVAILLEDENLNVDSIVDAVLESIDMKESVDTLTEINIELTKEQEITEE